jgi:hypothetical protein
MTKFFTYSTALLAGLALLGSTQRADAQQFSKRKQYTSVGVNLNAMNYFGDIVPKTGFASFRAGDTRYNLGLSITHRFFPRVSLRGSLSYGRIAASDEKSANINDVNDRYRNYRNMTIRNDIFEASGTVIVDLIENRNNYLKRPDFVPYLFVGVAAFHHNPQGLVQSNSQNTQGLTVGEYIGLHDLRTEGIDYSLTQIAIPFGGGVRYRINRNLDASFEIGVRKTFTDYLDDISTVFADPSTLATPASKYFGSTVTANDAPAGFNAANVTRGKTGNDWYVVTGFSLNYILTPKIKNPKFR